MRHEERGLGSPRIGYRLRMSRRPYPLFAPRAKAVTLAVVSCFSGYSYGNPVGPQVISGSASFQVVGKALNITNSAGAVINWQGFSIAADEVTRFLQSGAASSVLNRVTGGEASNILGQLLSNGRVFLINPNGVFIGAGAVVDVAGFVSSSLNLSDADFLAGKFRFAEQIGAGRIVNQGKIQTPAGGQVYLVAPNVENHGLITSPTGEVILAAGKSVELVQPASPYVRVELTAPDNAAVNVGQIVAQAGRVGIYGASIRNSGTVNASSASVDAQGRVFFRAKRDITLESTSRVEVDGPKGGSIVVQAESGTLLVDGAVHAKGDAERGGAIHLLGERVGLIGHADVDASGEKGGGTVLVGGDFQGKNADVQNAKRTFVGVDASIKVDARSQGAGGKAIVWADELTRDYGTISARGGASGGDGGFVEVSGKRVLDFQGRVDATAPNGRTGTLLLDPTDVTVVATGANATYAQVDEFADADQSGGSKVSPATLDAAGATVILQAQNDVTVTDAISLTTTPNASLTLQAGRSITVNNSVTTNGSGSITMVANNTDNSETDAIGNSLSGSGGINRGVGAAVLAVNGAISTGAGGSIKLVNSSTTANGGVTGSLTVGSPITTSASIGTSGNVTLAAGGSITVNVAVATGAVTASGAGSNAVSGGVTITAAGSISGAGTISTGAATADDASTAGTSTTANSGSISLTGTGANVQLGKLTTGAAVVSNVNEGASTDTATAGTITLSGASLGTSTGTPQTLALGAATGGAASVAGLLNLTATAGDIFVSSDAALRTGTVSGSGSGTLVSIAATGTASVVVGGGIATNGGALVLSAAGSLAVNEAINTSAGTAATAGGSVVLEAGGAISLASNGAITTTGNTSGAGGAVFIHHTNAAAGDITLGKDITATGGNGGDGGAVSVLNDSGGISVNGSLSVNGGAAGNGGAVQLTTTGTLVPSAITQSAAITATGVTGGSLKVTAVDDVTLQNAGNDVAVLAANITAASKSFKYTDLNSLSIDQLPASGALGSLTGATVTQPLVNGLATVGSGDIYVASSGSVSVNRDISAGTSGKVSIIAAGSGSDVVLNGRSVSSGTGALQVIAGRDISTSTASGTTTEFSTAGTLLLSAGNGIGSSSNRMDISVPVVAAAVTGASASGGVYLNHVAGGGGLVVGTATGFNGASNLSGISTTGAGGTVALSVAGANALTVSQGITAGGAAGDILLDHAAALNIDADISAARSVFEMGGGSVLFGGTGTRVVSAVAGQASFADGISTSRPLVINAGTGSGGGLISIASGLSSGGNDVELNGRNWSFTASPIGSVDAGNGKLRISHANNGTINLSGTGGGANSVLDTANLARLTSSGTLFIGDALFGDTVNVAGNADLAASTPNVLIQAASVTQTSGRIGGPNVPTHLLGFSTVSGADAAIAGLGGNANVFATNTAVGGINLNIVSGNAQITKPGVGAAVNNTGGNVDVSVQAGTLTVSNAGGGGQSTGSVVLRSSGDLTIDSPVQSSSGSATLVAGRAAGMARPGIGQGAWGTAMPYQLSGV